MSCELALGDMVTEFLLNTCGLRPPSTSEHALLAAVYCADCGSLQSLATENDKAETLNAFFDNR